MRSLFRVFAILDLLSLVFLGMQLVQIVNIYKNLTELTDKISSLLMFPMFLLVLVGAIGLLKGKKIGAIAYYISFPFRLYLWIFTLGFITLLPEALEDYGDFWPNILFKLCFVAEVLRLYLTIKGRKILI